MVGQTEVPERHQGVRGAHHEAHGLESDQSLENTYGNGDGLLQMLGQHLRHHEVADAQDREAHEYGPADEAAAEGLLPRHMEGVADPKGEVRIQAHARHQRQGRITQEPRAERAKGCGERRGGHHGLRQEGVAWRGSSAKDHRVHHQDVAHGHPGDGPGANLRHQGGAPLRDPEVGVQSLRDGIAKSFPGACGTARQPRIAAHGAVLRQALKIRA
mmetsp:Transcript_57211/g.185941  ORF Transcript_57211/g.185941 Transcript_57211/m.185941 type:complete len:215 (-) Transcript_57211:71-715(-)